MVIFFIYYLFFSLKDIYSFVMTSWF